MIPKIVHYIWFGGRPMPEKTLKCIDSWKTFLPDFRFIRWDETNFQIEKACLFVREAYESKQFAFVSDYVRFYVLYTYGGIYLDTDVEFIRSLSEEILNENAVLALDDNGNISGSTIMAEKGDSFIADCLKHYHNIPFIKNDGSFNNEVINTQMQYILEPYGYIKKNIFQEVDYIGSQIAIFPDEYFHVRSLVNGQMHITANSYCIHWHTILWASFKTRLINFLRIKIITKLFGIKLYLQITKMIKNGKTTI